MLGMGDAYLACQERIPQTLTLEMVQALEAFLPHIQVVAEQLAEELEREGSAWANYWPGSGGGASGCFCRRSQLA